MNAINGVSLQSSFRHALFMMVLRGYVVCSSRSAAVFAAPARDAEGLPFLRCLGIRAAIATGCCLAQCTPGSRTAKMHGRSDRERSHRVAPARSRKEKSQKRTTQVLVVALALAPAAAFVGPAPAAPSTAMKESLSDLKALQQSLPGPPNDYFDPLNLATMTFDWGPQGEEVLPRRRISPFRGAAAPSRHRRASPSREEVVGGFFFDFEAVRTARWRADNRDAKPTRRPRSAGCATPRSSTAASPSEASKRACSSRAHFRATSSPARSMNGLKIEKETTHDLV